jgi:hypothetical protein
MNNIPKVSLEDTLYLIQLMRETALSQGEKTRANRLTPVESEIRGLVSNTRQAQSPTAGQSPASAAQSPAGAAQSPAGAAQSVQPAAAPSGAAKPAAGILGQSDFKKLLEVTQTRSSGVQPVSNTNAALERNRMIQAMASADMSEIDIAQQFGMTRDEVRMVLSVQQKGAAK